MKNKKLTGGRVSCLASPSVISRTDCVNKVASKENHKKWTSPHLVCDGEKADPPSQLLTEIMPPFSPLNTVMAEQNLQSWSWDMSPPSLPRLLAFLIKAFFLSTSNCLWGIDF